MKGIFSVYDKKAAVFSTPFVSHGNATATRDFRSALNDPNSQICKFSDDYDLYLVGTWDEDSGSIVAENVPVFIVSGSSLKEIN